MTGELRNILISIVLLLFTLAGVGRVGAAELFVYPDSMVLESGESYSFDLYLDTQGETLGAVEIGGQVSGGISLVNVSNPASMIEIFVDQPARENNFRFVGGTPGGFNGLGIIARLLVEASNLGSGSILLGQDSKVILAGNKAKEAELNLRNASVRVEASDEEKIQLSSRSHPNQNAWLPSRKAEIHWNLEEGQTYSYKIDYLPTAIPDDEPDFPEGDLEWQGDVEFELPSDGVFYFLVKRVGEDAVSRYRLMADTEAPKWIDFEIGENVDPNADVSNQYLNFVAKDGVSGIDHYEVSVDDSPFVETFSPYVLPDGYKKAVVRAYDRAGNSISQTAHSRLASSWIILLIGLVFLGVVMILVFIGRKNQTLITPKGRYGI